MAKNPFYKRTKRGALQGVERELIAEIEAMCENKGIDVRTLDVASNVEELRDLRDAVELRGAEKSASDTNTNNNSDKPTSTTDKAADTNAEAANKEESFEAPEETKPNAEPTPEPSEFEKTGKSFDMADFVPQDNSNPFATEFIKEGREYATGEVNIGQPEAVESPAPDPKPERTPSVESVSEATPVEAVEPVNDSVASPWDVSTDNEVEVNNRESQVDQDLNSDDPEKVKLAETTKKKATKHIAKQAANLYAIVVEKAGKWTGQISEKTLTKLENEGKLDREFVIDDQTGETVDRFVDNHNDNLTAAVKLDEDVKDDFQEALELVMEKHQWEVTPEVNLAIVAISGFATTIQQARQCRNESMKVLDKASKTYQMVTYELTEAHSRNDELEAQIAELQAQLSASKNGQAQPSVQPSVPATENNLTVVTPPPIRKGSFNKKEADGIIEPAAERNVDFTEEENMIETITSPILEEKPSIVKKTTKKTVKKEDKK
jgi:hypothetical protein